MVAPQQKKNRSRMNQTDRKYSVPAGRTLHSTPAKGSSTPQQASEAPTVRKSDTWSCLNFSFPKNSRTNAVYNVRNSTRNSGRTIVFHRGSESPFNAGRRFRERVVESQKNRKTITEARAHPSSPKRSRIAVT